MCKSKMNVSISDKEMFDSSLKRIVSNDSAFGGSNTDTTDSGHLEDLEEVLHERYDYDMYSLRQQSTLVYVLVRSQFTF